MKKVIFLDIDGVMNDMETIHKIIHDKTIPPDKDEDDPSLEHLTYLKRIVDETGADIVLSSSWRVGISTTQRVMDSLASVGLHLRGITCEGAPLSIIEKMNVKPFHVDSSGWYFNLFGEPVVTDRGAEIAFWLHKHPEYTNFVVLDDEEVDIVLYYPNNVVKTNPMKGLLEAETKKAIEILNKTV